MKYSSTLSKIKQPPSRKLKYVESHAWLTLRMYNGIVTYDGARIGTIHTLKNLKKKASGRMARLMQISMSCYGGPFKSERSMKSAQ